MSTVIEPVGPLPRGTYWRRRLILLVIVLVAIAVGARACSSWGDDANVVVAPTPSPVSTSSTPTSSATPQARPTTTQTPKPAAKQCADAVIRVVVSTSKEQYPIGGPVPIRFVIGADVDTPCLRDVGTAANEVTVSANGTETWSTDFCNPGGEPDVRELSRTAPYVATVDWDGNVARAGCPAGQPKAPAGTYTVVGRNGQVKSPPVTFTLG